MVRGKGIKEILTPAEKEALNDQKRELETTLKEKKEYSGSTAGQSIDENRIKREIGRIDKAIADREPPRLNAVRKDKLAKELSEIEGRLSQGIPSRYEMDHPEKNAGAVRKHMRWTDVNRADIMRYKHLQRTLNPDNPESYERLRKEK